MSAVWLFVPLGPLLQICQRLLMPVAFSAPCCQVLARLAQQHFSCYTATMSETCACSRGFELGVLDTSDTCVLSSAVGPLADKHGRLEPVHRHVARTQEMTQQLPRADREQEKSAWQV